MKRKLFIILILCICLLSGCKWKKQTDLGIVVYTDKETGVQYLIYDPSDDGIAMCPRYNSDGEIYIDGR